MCSAFIQAIKDSSLGRALSPSLTANDLFTEYDTVLHSMADRFAPVHEVRTKSCSVTLTVVRR